MRKFKSNEIGRCPFCDCEDLDYGSAEFENGNMMYFPWTCSVCGNKGEEWYYMEFNGHNVEIEEGNIEITDDMIESEEK